MREVTEELARYLYNSDNAVYKLYEDGTEAQISDYSEISKHYICGGIFGIEEC